MLPPISSQVATMANQDSSPCRLVGRETRCYMQRSTIKDVVLYLRIVGSVMFLNDIANKT